MHKLLLLSLLILPIPALATIPVIDYASIARAAAQIQNQIKMIRSLPQAQWAQFAVMSQQLEQIAQQSQELNESLIRMNKAYKDKYPNSESKDFKATESQRATLETMHDSLNQMQESIGLMAQQRQLLSQLSESSKGSAGQVQALQTANEIALQHVQQLQNMQRILAAQAKAQIAYQAQKEAEEHSKQKHYESLIQGIPSNYEGSTRTANAMIPKMD